jgi:FKBP-type peptidyl-prolyl cis-trans isomerase FkpA
MTIKPVTAAFAIPFIVLALLAGCDRHKDATPTAAAPVSTSTMKTLQKTDTLVGAGKTATAGAKVTVNYTGWLYVPGAPQQHGAQFDSSIGREPFSFRLGSGGVIAGWDQGVEGMKVGGKRTLVIPAALGYGSDGAGPIPPNADLVFDIELLDVQ